MKDFPTYILRIQSIVVSCPLHHLSYVNCFQKSTITTPSNENMASSTSLSDTGWSKPDSDASSEWSSDPEQDPDDDRTYNKYSKKCKCANTANDSPQGDRYQRKKLRQTKARQRPDIPRRQNAFFDHFDRNIRDRIYTDLTFSPTKYLHQNPGGIDGHIPAMTWHHTREETREEADHQLRSFLKNTSDVYR